MENKFQSMLGGRVGEACTETTSYVQTEHVLKGVGLETRRRFDFARHTLAPLSAAVHDQRTAL